MEHKCQEEPREIIVSFLGAQKGLQKEMKTEVFFFFFILFLIGKIREMQTPEERESFRATGCYNKPTKGKKLAQP